MGEARNGQIAFDPLKENPRAALLLSQGVLYLTWASSCDVDPYHGWVMAYDPQTLAQRAILNVTPDGSEAGIWLGIRDPPPIPRATFTCQPGMALLMPIREVTTTATR